jgi:hypothetical protein
LISVSIASGPIVLTMPALTMTVYEAEVKMREELVTRCRKTSGEDVRSIIDVSVVLVPMEVVCLFSH